MKKDELMEYVGKYVSVTLFDGDRLQGVLRYTPEFSAKYDYTKPDYFYIGNTGFKVSHVIRFSCDHNIEHNL
jgi:hypothetical protein